MKRVLVLRVSMDPSAGAGTAVAAWTIEALRDSSQVSVLTCGPVDVGALNRYYGTTLRETDVRVHQVPAWVPLRSAPRRWQLLQHCSLMRRCHRVANEYDVVIGTDNETDFGRRGIQYIHYPAFHDPRVNGRVARSVESFALRWYHAPLLLRSYFRLSLAAAGFSMRRMRTNLTLVNSNWTGDLMRQVHGIDTMTVYPPVHTDFPQVAWDDREAGFVCVGRLGPEKRIETIIEILGAVRSRGGDVHLHIIGTPGPADYVAHIRGLQALNADWVSLECDLSRSAVAQLLATHRYGIHAMRREPFGIAVAEFLRAGCIPFVPDDGGLVEIVGGNPELVYDAVPDAAAKILAVIRDPARQHGLLRYLETCKALFSSTRFMEQMRAAVDGFSE